MCTTTITIRLLILVAAATKVDIGSRFRPSWSDDNSTTVKSSLVSQPSASGSLLILRFVLVMAQGSECSMHLVGS